jgi:hypothetical protein
MKTLILSIALLSLPVFLTAQLGLGIKIGANFANMSTDNFDNNSITSFHAGAYANIHFSDSWGVTPEVLWTDQGAELDGNKFKTDYIAVPIMLRWRIIDLISLEAGPQFNFLTKAESNGIDVTDDLTTPSYNAAFGALLHLPLALNAGIRYIVGFTDLTKSNDTELKDAVLQVYVGWTIFGNKTD